MSRIFLTAMSALILAGCNNAPAAPDTSAIPPAENKMVVLPANMTLGSAIVHPPRAKDGFGDMQTQTVGALNGLHALLKKQNLTLANVMTVRTTLSAGASGQVDYDAYQAGFDKFFGTSKFPNVPNHNISAARSLPVAGQLVTIEATIAVPAQPAAANPMKDTQ